MSKEEQSKAKMERIKKFATKYFVESDEEDKSKLNICIYLEAENPKQIKIQKPSGKDDANDKAGGFWPTLFKNFSGTDNDKKRALVHLESLLDMEKIKSKENQDIYHNNEKSYLVKISEMEKDSVVKEKTINDLK